MKTNENVTWQQWTNEQECSHSIHGNLFTNPLSKWMACIHVRVSVFAVHGWDVWSIITALWGYCASSFLSCVFMSSWIIVFACSRAYLWVHACFSHALSLCVEAWVWENRQALSNRERCFSNGCQNEFVTQSLNLRRKGTVERETFPRRPQSVRLIKSHGWSESWETEPECAEETCYGKTNKEIATCKY